MAVTADEAQLVEAIARQVLEVLLAGAGQGQGQDAGRSTSMPFPPSSSPDSRWPEQGGCPLVPVGVSVRHVHISRGDLDALFGPGYELSKLRDLTEPGEFAAREVVTVVGPKLRSMDNVRILGPLRKQTQVELALTDCILLGIDAPVRRSGDLAGSAPITLVGPNGTLRLTEGAIRANRHIHVPTAWLRHYGLANDQEVQVRVSGDKALLFENVQVRAGDELNLEMHLDTDDSNGAGLRCGSTVKVILPNRGGCQCSLAK